MKTDMNAVALGIGQFVIVDALVRGGAPDRERVDAAKNKRAR
jgi:hypothetical protein